MTLGKSLSTVNNFALTETAMANLQSKYTELDQELGIKTAFYRQIENIRAEKFSEVNLLERLVKENCRAEDLSSRQVERGWHKLEGLREIYGLLADEVRKLGGSGLEVEEKKFL